MPNSLERALSFVRGTPPTPTLPSLPRVGWMTCFSSSICFPASLSPPELDPCLHLTLGWPLGCLDLISLSCLTVLDHTHSSRALSHTCSLEGVGDTSLEGSRQQGHLLNEDKCHHVSGGWRQGTWGHTLKLECPHQRDMAGIGGRKSIKWRIESRQLMA